MWGSMCRSIVRLRGAEPSDSEVDAAALQFIRKIAGMRAPARANEEAFARAVDEIAAATRRMLDEWVDPPGAKPPATPPALLAARRAAAAAAARVE